MKKLARILCFPAAFALLFCLAFCPAAQGAKAGVGAGPAGPRILKTFRVSGDISVAQLSAKTFVYSSLAQLEPYGRASFNGLIFVDDGQAFLIDLPPGSGQTEELVGWIEGKLEARVAGAALSHWRRQGMGGLAYLHSRRIPTYGLEKTIALAGREGLAGPKHVFRKQLTHNFGSLEIQCLYLGGGPAEDEIVIWAPSEAVLFGSRLIREAAADSLGPLDGADLRAWAAGIDRLAREFPEAAVVVPGSGRPGGRGLLAHTRWLLARERAARP